VTGDRVSDRPARVLYVEDDPELARLLERYLEHEREGIAVETCEDPRVALDRIPELGVDCVISDYDMPGMDGLELLAAVREEFPELPFVLFTGKGSEDVASEAISKGVDDYLRKGTGDRLDVLARRVDNLVEGYRAKTSYREVFEKATVGLTVHDPETGEFVDANSYYCETTATPSPTSPSRTSARGNPLIPPTKPASTSSGRSRRDHSASSGSTSARTASTSGSR